MVLPDLATLIFPVMPPEVQVMVNQIWGLLIFTKLLISPLMLPNRYTAEEPQPCNDGASASEQDASLFR